MTDSESSNPSPATRSGWLLGAATALAALACGVASSYLGDDGVVALVIVGAACLLAGERYTGRVAPYLAGLAVLGFGLSRGKVFWDDRVAWFLLALFGLAAVLCVRSLWNMGRRTREAHSRLSEAAHGRGIRDAVEEALDGNRRRNFVEREFVRAQRYGRDVAVAVALIDNIELLRERNGAEATRDALVMLGDLASSDTRLPDGGIWDDFTMVFVLPETPLLGGRVMAERLRLAYQALHLPGADGIPLTVSVGVAAFPTDGERSSDVIEAAREALTRAVARGGNRTMLSRSPAGTPAGWSS